MGNIYSWKTFDHRVPAQDVGERIEELVERDGAVTKESLLDDARPAGAILHPLYEWDDSKAAERYRLYQSGEIINNLTVVRVKYTDEGEKETKAPAFVNVSYGKQTGSYRPITVVLREEDTANAVIENAKRDLAAMEQRLKNFIDFRKFLIEYAESI